MKARIWVTALVLGIMPAGLLAQAVPDSSSAARTDMRYRRTPTFRYDPFRHSFGPAWGFVISVGGSAENNTLNLSDVGALRLLSDKDKNPSGLVAGDLIDALGLVPNGGGLTGAAQGVGGFDLGGPIGSHLALELGARGEAFGSFKLDDDAVALFRDGNGARPEFSLGDSRAGGLAAASAGARMLFHLNPLGSIDGVRLTFGVGGRYLVPLAYARGHSLIANGGRIAVSGDSIVANLDLEAAHTVGTTDSSFSDLVKSTMKGSGMAADFLVRAEWPTAGLALEAMVANLGSVTIPNVEQRRLQVNIATTDLVSLTKKTICCDTTFNGSGPPTIDSMSILDTLKLHVEDTASVKVTLPRIVRFTASQWANRILQIDVSATMPITGEFAAPLQFDVGTTWRFIRTIPLRAGVVLGGSQGLGYTAGLGIEGRVFFLQLNGQSFGGLLRNAKGAGARFEWGLFF